MAFCDLTWKLSEHNFVVSVRRYPFNQYYSEILPCGYHAIRYQSEDVTKPWIFETMGSGEIFRKSMMKKKIR